MRTILIIYALQILLAFCNAGKIKNNSRCKEILESKSIAFDEFDIHECLELEGLVEGETMMAEEREKALHDALEEQGDGMVSEEVFRRLKRSVEGRRVKRGATKFNSRWDTIRDDQGNYLVPVEIASNITGTVYGKIQEVNASLANHTCIRLVNRTVEEPYIYIAFYSGCWSYVGRIRSNGYQKMSLGKNCRTANIVMHEMMHALGFLHEQSRPDRDDYVTIMLDNIKEDKQRWFRKYEQYKVDSFNSTFDLNSVMMYGAYAFAKNRSEGASIVDKETGLPIERDTHFTTEDIAQINHMYDCENKHRYCPTPKLFDETSYGRSSGVILKRRDRMRTFNHGEWLNITSCPNRHSAIDGVTKIFCVDGTFEPTDVFGCIEDPYCTQEDLPTVTGNGVIIESGTTRFEEGDQINLVCDQYHSPQGPISATCTQQGFNVSSFQCVEDPYCTQEDLPTVTGNGVIIESGTTRFEEGDKINLVCDQYHSPQGPISATCTQQGFNVSSFQCVEDPFCTPPSINGEGRLNEWDRVRFEVGETASVVCGHLHSVNGSVAATCGENGFDVTEFDCVDDYPNCTDDINNCARKAMLTGKCASSTAHQCERSCGCGEGPIVCKDLKPLDKCLQRQAKNHCENKYNFMYKNCRDTCGWCDEELP